MTPFRRGQIKKKLVSVIPSYYVNDRFDLFIINDQDEQGVSGSHRVTVILSIFSNFDDFLDDPTVCSYNLNPAAPHVHKDCRYVLNVNDVVSFYNCGKSVE